LAAAFFAAGFFAVDFDACAPADGANMQAAVNNAASVWTLRADVGRNFIIEQLLVGGARPKREAALS